MNFSNGTATALCSNCPQSRIPALKHPLTAPERYGTGVVLPKGTNGDPRRS